jgi:hypothetical protein
MQIFTGYRFWNKKKTNVQVSNVSLNFLIYEKTKKNLKTVLYFDYFLQQFSCIMVSHRCAVLELEPGLGRVHGKGDHLSCHGRHSPTP